MNTGLVSFSVMFHEVAIGLAGDVGEQSSGLLCNCVFHRSARNAVVVRWKFYSHQENWKIGANAHSHFFDD